MTKHPASAAPAEGSSAELDPASAAGPEGSPAGLDPVSSPAEPLIRPGPGLRLLAAVVLAILAGGVVGGAAAWAIYQHYGPVERNVYQQITGSPGSQAQTVGQLAQANAASVVTIATQAVTPADLAAGTASLVDGVIVSADGLILTSAHAVQNTSQLRVGLPDGRGYDAVIAKIDLTHGLAMLRITTATGLTPTGLTPIAFAAAPPSIGDEAIALSRSASGGLSVGVGAVSAVGLTVTTDTGNDQSVQGAVRIDATPEPDADGAPVLDSAGNLIGIVMTITQAPAPARSHRPLPERGQRPADHRLRRRHRGSGELRGRGHLHRPGHRRRRGPHPGGARRGRRPRGPGRRRRSPGGRHRDQRQRDLDQRHPPVRSRQPRAQPR